MASKKDFGRFTASAGKALKNGDMIACRIADDGRVYVCNEHLIFRMTPDEYAAAVQPVTCCEAGNWKITKGERRELAENELDLVKLFKANTQPTDESKSPTLAQRCPLVFDGDGGKYASYYNPSTGAAAFYNPLYMAAFDARCDVHLASATKAAQITVMAGGQADSVAIVLPMRAKESAMRAVIAYYASSADADAGETQAAELDTLRAELDRQRETITAQAAELDTLRAELAEARQAAQAAPAEDPAPDMKSAAEIIAARFTALAGVTATIRGAQTGAPVIWLDGDTKKHADAIQAAGAKWSTKKRAFYVRVA